MYTNTYLYISILTYIQSYICKDIYIGMCKDMYVYFYIYKTYTYMLRMHMYTYRHMHVHVHVHTIAMGPAFATIIVLGFLWRAVVDVML